MTKFIESTRKSVKNADNSFNRKAAKVSDQVERGKKICFNYKTKTAPLNGVYFLFLVADKCYNSNYSMNIQFKKQGKMSKLDENTLSHNENRLA